MSSFKVGDKVKPKPFCGSLLPKYRGVTGRIDDVYDDQCIVVFPDGNGIEFHNDELELMSSKSLPTAESHVKALRQKYGTKSILVDYDGDDVPYIQNQNSNWWATARFDRSNNVWRIDGREAQKLADELVRRGGRIIKALRQKYGVKAVGKDGYTMIRNAANQYWDGDNWGPRGQGSRYHNDADSYRALKDASKTDRTAVVISF